MRIGGEGAVGGTSYTNTVTPVHRCSVTGRGMRGKTGACYLPVHRCSVTGRGNRRNRNRQAKPPVSRPVHSFSTFMTPPKPDSAGPFVPLPCLTKRSGDPLLGSRGSPPSLYWASPSETAVTNILRYPIAQQLAAAAPRDGCQPKVIDHPSCWSEIIIFEILYPTLLPRQTPPRPPTPLAPRPPPLLGPARPHLLPQMGPSPPPLLLLPPLAPPPCSPWSLGELPAWIRPAPLSVPVLQRAPRHLSAWRP